MEGMHILLSLKHHILVKFKDLIGLCHRIYGLGINIMEKYVPKYHQ